MLRLDHIDQLRAEFMRQQSQFAYIIQEMEVELNRIKGNERVPQDVVIKKDLQIETLIKYNNRIEDLFSAYKLATLNLNIELMAVKEMLWEVLKSDKTAFEVLMRDIKRIKQQVNL